MARVTDVYLGLGGNIGDSEGAVRRAADEIRQLIGVEGAILSHLYRTAPVSPLPQPFYTNAAMRLRTSLNATELLHELQRIEYRLGKRPKPKEAPRIIDIDIILFGMERHALPHLEIPHPRWEERLFVLRPLLDLTERLATPGPPPREVELTSLIEALAAPK